MLEVTIIQLDDCGWGEGVAACVPLASCTLLYFLSTGLDVHVALAFSPSLQSGAISIFGMQREGSSFQLRGYAANEL